MRRSISQERPSGLAFLSIENENTKKIDLDKVINVFSKSKIRKKF